MQQDFITVRIWEKTKEKLEEVRIDKVRKEKKMVSLAKAIDDLVNEYLDKNQGNY